MALICSVAIDNAAFYFDKAYDYAVPERFSESIRVGCRVFVPFGRGNTGKQGIVLAVFEGSADNKKEITSLLDKEPLLDDEMMGLVKWIKDRTFSTYYDVVKTVLPAGLNMKTKTFYRACGLDRDKISFPDSDMSSIFDYLLACGDFVASDKILSQMCISSSSDILDKMFSKGLLEKQSEAVKKVGDLKLKSVCLNLNEDELQQIKFTEKQSRVVDFLRQVGSATVKEIEYFCAVSAAVADALVKKGAARYFDSQVYRMAYSAGAQPTEKDEIILTDSQQNAFEVLSEAYEREKGVTSLLYGVTGSGKTQVYLKLIDRALADGKDIIVMVPEISLSAQTVKILQKRYGNTVAVFHSRLSLGQRADEFKRVKNGQAKIAVGTRSAVFAPFKNLGLVIIDEEQEHTYKSEQSPRYDAREAAKYRCAYNKALLVLSSATPSVESFTYATTGKYVLASLPERYGKGGLPQVIVADMRGENGTDRGNNALGSILKNELIKNYNNSEQSILLINRRGYNTFVACADCGKVITCPHCSISLTYHRSNGRLMCHYCGYTTSLNIECPDCHSKNIRYSGSGTQRIEQELKELLPDSRVLRMDTDTTAGKNSHENMLNAFSDGEYDILLGTQMVAKGLDFPNVTLVGIVNADAALYNFDYRCAENSFDLITQVIGRAGRADKTGRAVIQTITPDNQLIDMAQRQDYEGFYKSEIAMRKLMIYPPYCDICTVGFVSSNKDYASDASKYFLSALIDKNKSEFTEQKFLVLGPTEALVLKANNKYRYRLMIKCKNTQRFRQMIADVMRDYFSQSRFKYVSLWVDINPRNIF